jgi:hypothetical protein
MKKVHDLVKMQNLIVDLYWEYDRMSSSGQNSLDKIAKIMKVPTENEIKQMSKETI